MERKTDILAMPNKAQQSIVKTEKAKRSFYQRLIMAAAITVGGVVLNILVYFLLARVFKINYLFSNAWAWLIYVVFMYATRKYFYFRHTATGFKAKWREFHRFVGLRVGTGILDMILMFILVSLISMHPMNAKIIDMVIISILNITLSNFWIFKAPKSNDLAKADQP